VVDVMGVKEEVGGGDGRKGREGGGRGYLSNASE